MTYRFVTVLTLAIVGMLLFGPSSWVIGYQAPIALEKALAKQLASKDKAVRIKALRFIAKRGSRGAFAISHVLGALQDSDAAVRVEAAKAIGQLGVTRTLVQDALRKSLRDRIPAVRLATRRSLVLLKLLNNRPSKWLKGNLKQVLKKMSGFEPLIVDVYADWCSPCNQLSMEILDANPGKKLLKEFVGVKVDFETPEGAAVTKKYRILGLPTVLILSPDGKEMGRVEGYHGRKEFVQAVWNALTSASNFPTLKKQATLRPKDPKAQFLYGRACLVKGKIKEAKKILMSLMKQNNPYSLSAYHTWGRWLLRVNKDAKRASIHFLKGAKVYRKRRGQAGLLYWAAKALYAEGKKEAAVKLFVDWGKNKPKSLTPLFFQADFMNHNRYAPQDIMKVLNTLAAKLKRKNSWYYHLLAQTKLRLKDTKGARKAIDSAIKLAPRRAIYQNFAKKLPKNKAKK